MAFYSKRLYRDVCFHWTGMGFQFLGLLVIILATAKGFALFDLMRSASDGIKAELAKTNPVITVSDGKATMVPESPVRIKHPFLDGDFIILDPNSDKDRIGEIGQGIYLAQDKLYIKLGEDRTVAYALSEFEDPDNKGTPLVVDREKIDSFLDVYVILVIPFFVTFGFMGMYLIYGLTVFAMGMVGVLFAKVWKADPGYPAMLRLAAVSMVPAGMLDAAVSLAHLPAPHLELAKIILTLVYMNIAVKWCFSGDGAAEAAG